LVLLVARPRLQALGIPVKAPGPENGQAAEHFLYTFLEERFGNDAYSRYNSLIRRIVSFQRALERERMASGLSVT